MRVYTCILHTSMHKHMRIHVHMQRRLPADVHESHVRAAVQQHRDDVTPARRRSLSISITTRARTASASHVLARHTHVNQTARTSCSGLAMTDVVSGVFASAPAPRSAAAAPAFPVQHATCSAVSPASFSSETTHSAALGAAVPWQEQTGAVSEVAGDMVADSTAPAVMPAPRTVVSAAMASPDDEAPRPSRRSVMCPTSSPPTCRSRTMCCDVMWCGGHRPPHLHAQVAHDVHNWRRLRRCQGRGAVLRARGRGVSAMAATATADARSTSPSP